MHSLLVLDDPFLSQDAKSAGHILHCLKELVKNGLSIIAVTQNTMACVAADTIFYIENGRIKECGTHEDLKAHNGSYSTMFDVF